MELEVAEIGYLPPVDKRPMFLAYSWMLELTWHEGFPAISLKNSFSSRQKCNVYYETSTSSEDPKGGNLTGLNLETGADKLLSRQSCFPTKLVMSSKDRLGVWLVAPFRSKRTSFIFRISDSQIHGNCRGRYLCRRACGSNCSQLRGYEQQHSTHPVSEDGGTSPNGVRFRSSWQARRVFSYLAYYDEWEYASSENYIVFKASR